MTKSKIADSQHFLTIGWLAWCLHHYLFPFSSLQSMLILTTKELMTTVTGACTATQERCVYSITYIFVAGEWGGSLFVETWQDKSRLQKLLILIYSILFLCKKPVWDRDTSLRIFWVRSGTEDFGPVWVRVYFNGVSNIFSENLANNVELNGNHSFRVPNLNKQ